MFQDSVPAGSYNDPFLSSVFVFVWLQVVCELSKLCVSKLCVDKLCVWGSVTGGRREEEGGSAQPKTRTPHKDVGNNPSKPDRNGSVKRPDRVARNYHRHSPCQMKIGSWPCPINQAKSFPPWQIARTVQASKWHQMEVQMFKFGLTNCWKTTRRFLA